MPSGNAGQPRRRAGSSRKTPQLGEFFPLAHLLDADTDAFTVGINVLPRQELAFGAAYGRETYSALQNPRNAAPLPSTEWTDPTRDWTLDHDEKVNNFTLYATRPS